LSVDVTAPGIGDWQACVNVRDLLAMVAKAGKGEAVKLRYDDAPAGVRVIIGAVQHVMTIRNPADFPTLETGELYPLDLDGAELLEALRFVSPAMSTEETRYYLNGAYLARPAVNGAHRLHVVATDGHSLHRWEGEAGPGYHDAPPSLSRESLVGAILVPRDTVKAILAMGGDGAGLTMTGNVKFVTATAGPVRLTSRLIDGSFPDYMRVIPTSHAYTMTADRAGLASAVANVATICDTDSRAVRFTLNHAAGSLALEARNMEGGKAAATLDVKADAKAWGKAHGKKGEPAPVAPESLEWGLNASYVRDALASLTGPSVTLDSVAPSHPCRLSCADDARRLVVLMPLRV
jgi:DNA polymerase-3 subunit beta